MANGHSAEGIEATRGSDYDDVTYGPGGTFEHYVSPETNKKIHDEFKREIDQKKDMTLKKLGKLECKYLARKMIHAR